MLGHEDHAGHDAACMGLPSEETNVDHLDLGLRELQPHTYAASITPGVNAIPVTDGVWGSLGKAQPVPLPAGPQTPAAAQ